MSALTDKAEAAVQRSVRLVNAWPQVGPGQGVPADAVQRAIAPLRSIAADVYGRAIGAQKGTIMGPGVVPTLLRLHFPWYNVIEAVEGAAKPATGYLSGSPVVTVEDRALALHVMQLIDQTLPGLGQTLVGSGSLGLIKEASHRLLAVATDLDINTTAADEVTTLWAATKESVRDLAQAVQRRADEGWSVLKTVLVVAGGVAGLVVARELIATRRTRRDYP